MWKIILPILIENKFIKNPKYKLKKNPDEINNITPPGIERVE